MRTLLVIITVFIIPVSMFGQRIEVINGHAHNDYENKNPLFDALDNGFMSIEVDVHLIDNELYVSHNYPKELTSSMTLESLYLNPLNKHILKNHGSVYPDYFGPFFLIIDIKSSAKQSYKKLKNILSNYSSIISINKDNKKTRRPVKILISGNRPVKKIINDDLKYVGIDGRPKEIKKNIPTSIMPVISQKYSRIISWNGVGKIKDDELLKLNRLIKAAHAQNKLVRLWAAPDNEVVWKLLLDHKIDLINTDRIKDFREFYLKYFP